jgi:hypothetical protein
VKIQPDEFPTLIEKATKIANDACVLAFEKHQKEPFGEPINWGDLGCDEILFQTINGIDFDIVAVVDEAAPSACPNLETFIRGYAKSQGFTLIVKTE